MSTRFRATDLISMRSSVGPGVGVKRWQTVKGPPLEGSTAARCWLGFEVEDILFLISIITDSGEVNCVIVQRIGMGVLGMSLENMRIARRYRRTIQDMNAINEIVVVEACDEVREGLFINQDRQRDTSFLPKQFVIAMRSDFISATVQLQADISIAT
jgi:hypothetical protein